MPAPTYAAAATTALPQPTLVLPAPSAAAAAAEVVDAPVFIKTRAPRHRPWRSKGSGRCPHGRQVQLDLSGLITAAVAWEESQRQQQAAKAAAEAAAAVTRAAAVTPGNMRAAAAAATPASASRWSPIEGIPELRSRPPRRRPAAAAATPNDLTFTPMEGVPETARGFRRAPATAAPPSRAPVPRFEFTPIEGVPEKAAMGSASAGFAAARMQRAVDAAAADDDNDGGYDGDYDDGGWNDMAQAAQHVSSVVQGIANASPLTPSVPLQLAQSGATARRTASRVAAAAAAAGGSQGPSPLHLTPAEQEVAAAAKKRRRLPAQTPREGRWAKSRKSLACELVWFRRFQIQQQLHPLRTVCTITRPFRSPIALDPPDTPSTHPAADGMKTGEDGRRQSTRVRHAPLEYWRNERKELCRVHKSEQLTSALSRPTELTHPMHLTHSHAFCFLTPVLLTRARSPHRPQASPPSAASPSARPTRPGPRPPPSWSSARTPSWSSARTRAASRGQRRRPPLRLPPPPPRPARSEAGRWIGDGGRVGACMEAPHARARMVRMRAVCSAFMERADVELACGCLIRTGCCVLMAFDQGFLVTSMRI